MTNKYEFFKFVGRFLPSGSSAYHRMRALTDKENHKKIYD